ncbi:hypothetical protein A9404_12060 [Halothiobacillus diazotrophicus]|uniref:Protein CyaE n=2 Tax=Halothiobacillus diazotrophicus TaxID=1860122 RepID=A0A191ZJE7_9GAMM|nr:hypothetical protein A9404_12060 [Halothiobacillus diazotrophicus]
MHSARPIGTRPRIGIGQPLQPIRIGLSACFLSLGILWGMPPVHADPFGTRDGLPGRPGQPATTAADLYTIPTPGTLPARTERKASTDNRPYTLAELSAMALQNNPQTRMAWASLQAQAAGLGMAESAWLPKINLTVGAQQAQSTTSAGYQIPRQRTVSPNLSLSWLIWDFGQRDATIDAARAAVIAARFANDQTIQQVLASVATAYYQSLADRVLVDVDRQALVAAQSALEAAEARHRAGQATISDVYQARSARAKAQGSLDTAIQTRLQNMGALASSVGLPVTTDIRLAPLNTQANPKLDLAVHDLLDQAIQRNPNLQNAQAQVVEARANLDHAERAWLPTLSLGANEGMRIQQGLGRTQTNSIGLTLSVPLFTGFNQQYQTAQARAKLQQSEANRDNTYQSTELGVWQDYYAYQGAVVALPSARAQEENAAQALKAVEAQYRVGYATIQDLLTAQSTLTSAQLTVAQNALNAYTALAKLGSAIGLLGTPPFSPHGRLDPVATGTQDNPSSTPDSLAQPPALEPRQP